MTASFRRIGDTPVAALAVIFAALFACSASIAAESVPPAGQRVFVCAHSFMIYTAKLLPPMAEAAGIAHVNAGQQMIGGSRVIQHWDLPEEKNRAKAALRESKVDVLTLSPNALMPDPGINHFTKLGLEKNPPCACSYKPRGPPARALRASPSLTKAAMPPQSPRSALSATRITPPGSSISRPKCARSTPPSAAPPFSSCR